MIKFKNILLSSIFILCCIVCNAQTSAGELNVSGKVLDAGSLKPLAGMSISLPGVSAAMTNDKGEFKIKVPSYNVELSVSGPMYQSKKVALKGHITIEIRLYESGFNSVYKDVLMPLAETNNAYLTNSVSFLSHGSLNSIASTPEKLLQGSVAGLNTIMRSGLEGSGANLYLRGFNSIYTNNQPLLVIDGMVVESQSFGTSLIQNYISTPFGSIDVKDIERMTVIKDGTSLYGVKGANGIILIETLRSKSMPTKINFNLQTGMNMQPNKIPMLGASAAKKYLIDMYQSSGKYTTNQIQNLAFVNQEIPVLRNWGYEGNVDFYRYNKNTDWQDELFTESFKQNYSLNVTGGDEVAVYALSAGYLQNEGLIAGTDYSRFNARVNTEINFSPKMKVRTNMSLVYGKKNLRDEGGIMATNPVYSSLVKAPFMAGNIYDQNNLMSPNYEDVDMFGLANPLAIANNVTQENSNYRFMGSVDIAYNPRKNLKVSTNFGVHYNKDRERIFLPGTGIPYDTLSNSLVTNKLQHRVERLFTLFNETRVNYIHNFSHDHSLDATVGLRYLNTNAEDDWGKGYNSVSDNFTSLDYGLNTLRQTGGSIGKWNWLAYFANVNYNLRNKYFLTATTSFDASSRYGESISKYQMYPSISGAWLISSEDFMKDISAFDMLKLRAAYSISGNDDIGNYSARRYYVPQNFLGNYGLIRGNLVNTNLKPERSAKLNIGVDLSLLNERLSFSADLYKTRITDMITYSPVSPISGFSTYISNGGEMDNNGLDLALNVRLINTSVKWDLGMNVSFYKNEIKKLNGNAYQTSIAGGNIITQVGSPLGLFYGYKTDGIYTTSTEASAKQLYHPVGTQKLPFTAGDVKFVNTDSSNDLIDEKDMQVIGDPNPDFFGGITTNLEWKRFKASALFTYSVGNDIYNYTRRELESMSGYANQTEAVQNRWKYEGQNTNIPKAVFGDPMGNSRFSDRWIEDGSYLKLKNVQLSYDLPVKSGLFTGITIYAAAENLLTITNYKGYDPEICASTNPLGAGIDAFTTPQVRTFYVGLKIGL
ncbi:TonB-linked outer membrane protein, SusC/RagA family [Bacteroides luti]|uniref:TonB-linked outer membrane protein, SusC/RagA family n=1 Tax=Bacteroides luti TaxID=1297750 RepID=A0A1M5F1H0_9BACE|nr:SusC/RagA family TonB-linked outer membrane protein [Bacteroides luti]SHF85329.1 TonB-linked outer membrane protein, SusC/RagA family [Bacteroides luti]